MKKINNKGFMLAETLIVTVFVASALIFMYVEYNNLNKLYNDSYDYNSVEKIYALEDIRDLVLEDINMEEIDLNNKIKDITECSLFSKNYYCKKIFELDNVDKIILSLNNFDSNLFINYEGTFYKFIKKIKPDGNEKYRLIASFKDGTYATIRFGGLYE